MTEIKIVTGAEKDLKEIIRFIKALAVYEKLENEVVVTEDLLKKNLFGEKRFAEVIFLQENSINVGFALFFNNFSTFLGTLGIYLEDLFVFPEHRGKGFGKAILTYIAALAVERGYGRFEWSVQRLSGEALRIVASQSKFQLSN